MRAANASFSGRTSELSGIAERLSEIRRRVAAASARRQIEVAGAVVLVGASKRQPIEALKDAWDAGLRVFGENRVQEAEAKQPHLPKNAEWHLIGPLQSNKAQRAVRCFDAIHSIDRLKIARAVDRHAAAAGRTMPCFLEVNLAGEPTKSGFPQSELRDAALTIAALPHIDLVGLMAIPPRSLEPEGSRPWFRRLRELRDELRPELGWSTEQGLLSMGMSDDFEIAVEEGATHVRVGTSLFGPRPPIGT